MEVVHLHINNDDSVWEVGKSFPLLFDVQTMQTAPVLKGIRRIQA